MLLIHDEYLTDASRALRNVFAVLWRMFSTGEDAFSALNVDKYRGGILRNSLVWERVDKKNTSRWRFDKDYMHVIELIYS